MLGPLSYPYEITRAIFRGTAGVLTDLDLLLMALTLLSGGLLLLGRRRSTAGFWLWAHLSAATVFWVVRIVLFYFLLEGFRIFLAVAGLGMLFVFMAAAVLLIGVFVLGLVLHYGPWRSPVRERLLQVHVGVALLAVLLSGISLAPLAVWP